jgi:hypothetical protein
MLPSAFFTFSRQKSQAVLLVTGMSNSEPCYYHPSSLYWVRAHAVSRPAFLVGKCPRVPLQPAAQDQIMPPDAV